MSNKNTLPKIVLLHGWSANAPVNIMPLAEELRGKGYEVFLPHLPGFGESSNPPIPWFVEDYVEWVREEIKKKGWENVIICGHSFGGRIGMKMAKKYPDMIEKLVLMAAAGIKHELGFKAKLVRAVGSLGRFFFNLPLLNKLQPIMYSFWKTILGRKDYYKVSGVMQKTFINVVEEDLRPIVPMISVPTLVMWGKKDAMVPIEDAYFLEKSINNSRLKVYSQGDHKIPYDYPKEIAEEIDEFVKK